MSTTSRGTASNPRKPKTRCSIHAVLSAMPTTWLAEKRSAVVGAAGGGRLLFVVFVRRGELIRVISARDAVESEKRAYRRRRK